MAWEPAPSEVFSDGSGLASAADGVRQQENKVPGHVASDSRPGIQRVLGLRGQGLNGLVLQVLQIPGVGVQKGVPVRLPHRRQGGIEETVRQRN